MNRVDINIASVGDELRAAGFQTGDKVSVVRTDEVKSLETRLEAQRHEIDRLTKTVRDLTNLKNTLQAELTQLKIQNGEQVKTIRKFQNMDEVKALDNASTAYVVKKADGTYVRRGKNALYITYSRSMAKHRAAAFLGSTVHEVKLVINPQHVASTCSGCGRINHG